MADRRLDTWTKDELLAARSEADRNSNGTLPEVAPRTCPVCGGAVPDGRRVTCSSACAKTYHGRDRKRTRAAAKPAMAKTSVPAGIPLAPSGPGGGLSAAVMTLASEVGELGGIQRVTIELDSQVITITRA